MKLSLISRILIKSMVLPERKNLALIKSMLSNHVNIQVQIQEMLSLYSCSLLSHFPWDTYLYAEKDRQLFPRNPQR